MSEMSILPPQSAEGMLSFELESDYQGALARLRKKSSKALGGLLLVGSLVAFLAFQRRDSGTAENLAILAAVLFLHEAGHFLAMRVFGWRDLKMFFIPFFGAAVSGKRNGAESWKEGVVLLAGPVPGLLAGVILAAVIRTEGSPLLRTAAAMLILINAFNLLPLAVLDGGKLLQLTIFQRNRKVEVAFLVVASLGLLVASALLDDPVIRYAGIGTLVSIPLRTKLLNAAHKLREKQLALPSDARELDGDAGREVFLHARESLKSKRPSSAQLASAMESLVDLVSRTVPSNAQTALLLAAWGLALAGGAGGKWLLSTPVLRWRAVSDPAGVYTAWFPDEPKQQTLSNAPAGTAVRSTSVAHGDYGFSVVDVTMPPDAREDLAAWRSEAVDYMTRTVNGRVLQSEGKDFLGNPGFQATVAHGPHNRLRMIGFSHGGHRYVLSGTAPEGDPSVQQFIDSFDLKQ